MAQLRGLCLCENQTLMWTTRQSLPAKDGLAEGEMSSVSLVLGFFFALFVVFHENEFQETNPSFSNSS